MAGGRIKHVFPDSSTPQGFFSYYSYIIPAETTKIFGLQGGPGTVRSNLLKNISQELLLRGYDLEHHHYANDPSILHSLVIPDLNTALVDDTSPHLVGFKHICCVDEILNLGDYGPDERLRKNKAAKAAAAQEINQNLEHAYRMLKAAKAVYDDWKITNSQAMNYALANKKTTALVTNIFNDINCSGYGKSRKLFASALTPFGPVNYLDSIAAGITCRYILTGLPGTGKSTLLATVANAAITRGLNIEIYYCPLDPAKIEHVIIPALNAAILTSTPPHNLNFDHYTAIIDMNECLDLKVIRKLEPVTDYDRTAFWEFFGKAGSYLKTAKTLRDEWETDYLANIAGGELDTLQENMLARITANRE